MFKFIPILLLISFTSFANQLEDNTVEQEVPLVTELPTFYSDFVDIIGLVTAEEIIAILGEPAKKIDIRMKSTNDVIASTWYYHNLNTDDTGKYFPTTELDIVDGYVESVVFMNEVDENSNFEGNKYEIPNNNDKMI